MWLSKPVFLLALCSSAVVAQYTGPCSASNCGADGRVCRRGWLCVPWPSFDPALRKGCTCSLG
ncbi:hypothetical protein QBC35DRAFT_393246 [Podospora australis]|uniref:Uncharacterized protein n=1 Tax=Podospora australis TaxID=1536484 RepID=A0AAN6WLU5_9PEZI|nr:hypothetical protein QBC35DRAFT_393246 [Podospora australis]